MKKLFLVILSLLVVGCSNLAPEEKELVGQWVTYGLAGGPNNSDIKPARIVLEISPDNTYSYYTPALQGYGLVADRLIDIPATQRYGKWRIEKSRYSDENWKGGGFWEACCICTTPEYEDGGIRRCDSYTLKGDNLTTSYSIFPVPFLGDELFPVEWTRIK